MAAAGRVLEGLRNNSIICTCIKQTVWGDPTRAEVGALEGVLEMDSVQKGGHQSITE
jgi:hypothetical protein